MQGGTGGEGQGENPNAALRSASPLEAASLRAAVLGGPSDGERRAALERKDGNSIGTTCGTDLLQWFTVDAPRLGMSRTGAIAAMQRGGVSDADIGAALAELERRENGDNRDSPPAVDRERRCVAVTTAGLDCVRRPVRGSLYCALHQLMKHEQAPPETEHA